MDIHDDRDFWHGKYQALLAAVVEHHAQRADDRCWMDDCKLYEAAGLDTHDNRIGDPMAMLVNCQRFISQRCAAGGPWKSYAALETALGNEHRIAVIAQAQNAALRSLVAAMTAIDDAIVAGHDPGEEIQLFAGLELKRREAFDALAKAEGKGCSL